MISLYNVEFKEHINYPSRFKIGEEVEITLEKDAKPIRGFIRTVTFTNGKVRYSIRLDNLNTTIHNIDSILVMPVENPKFIDMGFDNYS